jgi:CDP-glucose 4,6-dehydratase
MHYLVTGHTGFKGSWLTLWLKMKGHQVSGISLDPVPGGLFETAEISTLLENDFRIDIRNRDELIKAVQQISPDVVFHLAAQPLVRESYRDPRGTFETNVNGTLHMLEAVSQTPSVKAHVVITTDKVYRNVNQVKGYVETDPLGGDDPYSASKAMADLLTQSWVKSFPGAPTAIARAGNVIGFGDVSKDRLVPDLVNSYTARKPAVLRYPNSVRPWQHVLDCLNGYMMLADALLEGEGQGEWNFGPGSESFVSVSSIAEEISTIFSIQPAWESDFSKNPHEAELLALDCNKAQEILRWNNKLSLQQTIHWAANPSENTEQNARTVVKNQIAQFMKI